MIILLTTYPDMKSAETAAELLVTRELAACINIIRSESSIYRWKGKLEKHSEFILLIKTNQKAYSQIELFIKQNNPSELPEIAYFEIKGGHRDYLSWVDSSVLSKLLSVPLDFRAIKRVDTPSKESINARKPATLSN